MALGDESILGPYKNSTAGVTSMAADMDAATVTNTDSYVVVMGAGNLDFHVIHIEGV